MCGNTRNPATGGIPSATNYTPSPSWIPQDQASQSSFLHARTLLHTDILYHSLRVYRYAVALRDQDTNDVPQLQPTVGKAAFGKHDPFCTREPPPSDALLFAAAIFHDIGTCERYNGEQRFEVCGADAALENLESFGTFGAADLREIWTAIALHSSPGIAERMSPLTRLLRMAVKADLGTQQWRQLVGEQVVRETEALLPRGDIEIVLAGAIVEQAKLKEGEARSTKAPKVSWPWNLLRARLEDPSWEGLNPGF